MTCRVYRGRTIQVIARLGPIPCAHDLREFRPEFTRCLRRRNPSPTKVLGSWEWSDKLGECLHGFHWDPSAACGSTVRGSAARDVSRERGDGREKAGDAPTLP